MRAIEPLPLDGPPPSKALLEPAAPLMLVGTDTALGTYSSSSSLISTGGAAAAVEERLEGGGSVCTCDSAGSPPPEPIRDRSSASTLDERT